MIDELTIAGIECFGHHGVFDFERRDGQVFVIDLALGLDTAAAAASDDLQDTVDYGSLVAAVKAAVEQRPRRPDRDAGRTDCGVCLRDDRVEWSRVTVHKPDAPIDATYSDVALTITRKREGRRDRNPQSAHHRRGHDHRRDATDPSRRPGAGLQPRGAPGPLQGAVDALKDTPDVFVTAVSPIYETEPGRRPRGLRRLPQRGRPDRHHARRRPG